MKKQNYDLQLDLDRTILPIPATLIMFQQKLLNNLPIKKTPSNGGKLLSFCKTQGWDSKILGTGELVEQPIRLGTWLIIPSHLDENPMPERAMERIQTIFANGFRPKGFFIIHEAPMQLPEKIIFPEPPKTENISPENREKIKSTLSLGGKVLGGVAVATGSAVLGTFALAMAGLALLPVLAIGALVVLDPILVAVTDDGSWVEIDRWWN